MKYINTCLLACLLLSAAMASAGPSAHRTQGESGLLNNLFGSRDTEPEQPTPATRPNTAQNASRHIKPGMYDGVWRNDHDRIVLIKQIHRTLYVSGSSDHAAWQAQCVTGGDSASCVGSGISNTAGEFRYESSLHADGLRLQSAWTRRYRSGHTRSGRSTLISR